MPEGGVVTDGDSIKHDRLSCYNRVIKLDSMCVDAWFKVYEMMKKGVRVNICGQFYTNKEILLQCAYRSPSTDRYLFLLGATGAVVAEEMLESPFGPLAFKALPAPMNLSVWLGRTPSRTLIPDYLPISDVQPFTINAVVP